MAVAWPLKVSASGRYLVDQNGVPFPVLDYSFWGFGCVSSTADMNAWISALQSLGVTSVHVSAYVGGVICTTGTPPNTVSKDASGNLPFLKNNDGSTYTSTYGGNGDLSQYNDSFFSSLSTVVTACQTAGILVFLWPAYLGFGAGVQGLGSDMSASGATKANTFASYFAGKITQPNVVLMAYGDDVPTSTLQTVHGGYVNTLVANAKQALLGGHYPAGYGDPCAPNNTDTAGSTPVNSLVNVRTIYDWNASTDYTSAYSNNISACQASPVLPSLKIDTAAYEGLQGANSVIATPTDTRNNFWWSLLSSVAGVSWANTFTQYAGSQDGTANSFTFANGNTSSGLLSDGHKHLKAAISIWKGLPWWRLLPANVGGMDAIVASGGGSSGSTNFVTAAADASSNRRLVCLYLPPSSGGSVTLDMTRFAGKAVARWWDPTTGQVASTSEVANTSSSVSFAPPSTLNAYGGTDANAKDWVLTVQVPDLLAGTLTAGRWL